MPNPKLNPVHKSIILLLVQNANKHFGLSVSELSKGVNVSRMTVQRAIEAHPGMIRMCEPKSYPAKFYVDEFVFRQQAPMLGLAGEATDSSASNPQGVLYKTHFGNVTQEQPVKIISASVEEMIESLKNNTPQALEILENLPHMLEEAYEAVSEGRADKETTMQAAWNALESARAVAAMYQRIAELYMFDPRMATPEYWSVFMHRIPGFHEPIARSR